MGTYRKGITKRDCNVSYCAFIPKIILFHGPDRRFFLKRGGRLPVGLMHKATIGNHLIGKRLAKKQKRPIALMNIMIIQEIFLEVEIKAAILLGLIIKDPDQTNTGH